MVWLENGAPSANRPTNSGATTWLQRKLSFLIGFYLLFFVWATKDLEGCWLKYEVIIHLRPQLPSCNSPCQDDKSWLIGLVSLPFFIPPDAKTWLTTTTVTNGMNGETGATLGPKSIWKGQLGKASLVCLILYAFILVNLWLDCCTVATVFRCYGNRTRFYLKRLAGKRITKPLNFSFS